MSQTINLAGNNCEYFLVWHDMEKAPIKVEANYVIVEDGGVNFYLNRSDSNSYSYHYVAFYQRFICFEPVYKEEA